MPKITASASYFVSTSLNEGTGGHLLLCTESTRGLLIGCVNSPPNHVGIQPKCEIVLCRSSEGSVVWYLSTARAIGGKSRGSEGPQRQQRGHLFGPLPLPPPVRHRDTKLFVTFMCVANVIRGVIWGEGFQ